MDSFETIIAKLLEQDGYWVRRNCMVALSKKDKRDLGKHTMPRPEIDLVAFSPKRKYLLIIECKSYLDSRGIGIETFKEPAKNGTRTIRLFTDSNYRKLVSKRLVSGFRSIGLLNGKVEVRFGLVCGKVIEPEAKSVADLFSKNGWLLWPPSDVAGRIRRLAGLEYENNLATMIAKILERNPS